MQNRNKSIRRTVLDFARGSARTGAPSGGAFHPRDWPRLVTACNVLAQHAKVAAVFSHGTDVEDGVAELERRTTRSDARLPMDVLRVFLQTQARTPGGVAVHLDNTTTRVAAWDALQDGAIPRASPGPQQDLTARVMTAMWCIARATGRLADVTEADTALCQPYIAHVLSTYA